MNNSKEYADIAARLRRENFTTKEDLFEWIDEARETYKKNSESDTTHSAAFYHVLDNLLAEFRKRIEETVLFERLEDFWKYSLVISFSGARLFLQHMCAWVEDVAYLSTLIDQEFLLIECKTKLLTVEEYASLYGVNDGTVRQWIRRGKLRNAIKFGKEWRIPELCEMPGRGYSPATYAIKPPLKNLPKEYEFLRNCISVMIEQDADDKNLFNITYYQQSTKPNTVVMNTIVFNSKEREHFEVFLISHPDITNADFPTDDFNAYISSIAKNRVEKEVNEVED